MKWPPQGAAEERTMKRSLQIGAFSLTLALLASSALAVKKADDGKDKETRNTTSLAGGFSPQITTITPNLVAATDLYINMYSKHRNGTRADKSFSIPSDWGPTATRIVLPKDGSWGACLVYSLGNDKLALKKMGLEKCDEKEILKMILVGDIKVVITENVLHYKDMIFDPEIGFIWELRPEATKTGTIQYQIKATFRGGREYVKLWWIPISSKDGTGNQNTSAQVSICCADEVHPSQRRWSACEVGFRAFCQATGSIPGGTGVSFDQNAHVVLDDTTPEEWLTDEEKSAQARQRNDDGARRQYVPTAPNPVPTPNVKAETWKDLFEASYSDTQDGKAAGTGKTYVTLRTKANQLMVSYPKRGGKVDVTNQVQNTAQTEDVPVTDTSSGMVVLVSQKTVLTIRVSGQGGKMHKYQLNWTGTAINVREIEANASGDSK